MKVQYLTVYKFLFFGKHIFCNTEGKFTRQKRQTLVVDSHILVRPVLFKKKDNLNR